MQKKVFFEDSSSSSEGYCSNGSDKNRRSSSDNDCSNKSNKGTNGGSRKRKALSDVAADIENMVLGHVSTDNEAPRKRVKTDSSMRT